MSQLLIDEPPLLVLPSLAREVGLPAGILLQQLHYAGGKTSEGWVTRSALDWSRALRRVLAPRTIERAFAKLKEGGWVESASSPGQPTAYRVTRDKVAGVGSAAEAGAPPPERRGSLSREELQRDTPSISPKSEHPEFSEWVGHHHEITGSKVPKAGTAGRRHFAAMFAARREDGLSLDDLKAATLGAFHDEYRREHGHYGHESVLRPLKCNELVSKGRRWLEAQAEQRTDWTKFDE